MLTKEAAQEMCLQEMEKHRITEHGFTFKWIKTRSTWAFCHANPDKVEERRIELSEKLLKELTPKKVHNLVLHEIAHALDFIRSGYKWRHGYIRRKNGERKRIELTHDKVWRGICAELGYFPRPGRVFE